MRCSAEWGVEVRCFGLFVDPSVLRGTLASNGCFFVGISCDEVYYRSYQQPIRIHPITLEA